MTATDERPLVSPAPQWVNDLAAKYIEQLDPIFEKLWEEALHGAAAEVEAGGNPAESQNNALSVFGQVASYPITLQAQRIGETKGVPPPVAVAVAMHDTAFRVQTAFAKAMEGAR